MRDLECEITETLLEGCPSFGLRIVFKGEEFSFPDLCTDRAKLMLLTEALDEFPGQKIMLELFDDFLYS